MDQLRAKAAAIAIGDHVVLDEPETMFAGRVPPAGEHRVTAKDGTFLKVAGSDAWVAVERVVVKQSDATESTRLRLGGTTPCRHI